MDNRLSRVIPALATALNKDGSFDEQGMRRLVKHAVVNGMETLFILGFAGEVLTFSRKQRQQIIRTVKDEAGDGITIIAGCFDNSTERIIEHMDDAYRNGADLVLTTPTDFYFLTEDEIKSLFVTLADNSKIPVIIYNCPENRHYLTPDIIKELSEHHNIFALKETSNIDKLQRMMRIVKTDDNFTVMNGEEFTFYPAMALGAQSFIMGGPGNILPKNCNMMFESFRAGNYDKVKKDYSHMINFLYELYSMRCTEMASIKGVLELNGICGRWMRHPVSSVTDEEMEHINKLMKKYGVTAAGF